MKRTNKIWGIVLIVLGILIALKTLNIVNIDIFFKGWWTLFIIIPSGVGLIKDDDKAGNIIGIIIGVMLLLAARQIIPYKLILQLFIPIVLVIIGLSLLFKDKIKEKMENTLKDKGINEENTYYATFGAQNINLSDVEIKNMELNAIFGGIKCNLKESIIKEDVMIKVSSIFGGTTLTLPKDVKVKVLSTPIFGGVDNKHNDPKEEVRTIYINAICLFGGLDIR